MPIAPLICDNVKVTNYSMGMQAKHRVDLVRWKLPQWLGMSFNDRLPYPINYVPAQVASGSIKLYIPVFLRQVDHLFTVWGLMTPDSMTSSHGLCRLNAYFPSCEISLWFLDRFYKVQVVVWDATYTLHEQAWRGSQ